MALFMLLLCISQNDFAVTQLGKQHDFLPPVWLTNFNSATD